MTDPPSEPYEVLLERQHALADALKEAKREYERITDLTRDAFADQKYGVPWRFGGGADRRVAPLFMVAPDGSAVYRGSGRRNHTWYYYIRSPQGELEKRVSRVADIPKRGFVKIESSKVRYAY
jgi:hypothetical protein